MDVESHYFNTKIIVFRDCKKMRETDRVDVEVERHVAWEQTVIGRPILMEEEKMTKVEAIKFGTAWLGIQEKLEGCEMYEFFKMSVKALQEEPCDDCVRRQEVLDILKDEWNKFSDANDAMQESINAIKALKSVTPKQEPRWIPVSERLPEKNGAYLAYIINPSDDECRYIMTCEYFVNDPYHWCPDDETASHNVVAWMPLPEPYKAEGSDKE